MQHRIHTLIARSAGTFAISLSALWLAGGLSSVCAAPAEPAAGTQTAIFPVTEKGDAVTELHGEKFPDPYRWLEDITAPKVQAWIDAQNNYVENQFALNTQTEPMRKRVRELRLTQVQRYSPVFVEGTMFYLQFTPPQSRPLLVSQKWPDGEQRVLVDLSSAPPEASITGFWPSPRGRFVAYGVGEGHDEISNIRVVDTLTGRNLPDRLSYVGGTVSASVAWDSDERGFDYVRLALPKPGKKIDLFDAAVYHHTFGTDPRYDPLSFSSSFSPFADLRLPIAEYHLLSSEQSQHTALLANTGDGGPSIVFIRDGRRWKRVLGEDAGVRAGNWVGDRLFVIATGKTPRGSLLAISADGHVSEVLAQSATAMQMVTATDNGFLLTRSWGTDTSVEQYDSSGKFLRTLPLPPATRLDTLDQEGTSSRVLLTHGSWASPARWSEYDTHTGTLKTVFEIAPIGDYSKLAFERTEAVSDDGAKIPITIVALAGTKRELSTPVILSAYGAFGLPLNPYFLGSMLAWLERGGVYAVANVRGGNEFGEDWHQQGMKLNKQKGADDLYAAARLLIAQHRTSQEHLGLLGYSGGGLLMGMAITQHPTEYRAAVIFGGMFDMLRNETFPNGRFTVGEFGSVNDPEQFRATSAYSPLQHVQPRTAYPAVLLNTVEDDLRVASWQSRKFGAALQAATSSGRPIEVLTRSDREDPRSLTQRTADNILSLAFFAEQLGLPPASGSEAKAEN